jgi:glutamine synthetase
MAKPFEHSAGTGMHIHVSLADEEGNNLFADEDPMGTELLRHAIGGLRETMAESMLIFAPHANSYRRFRKLSYAPVTTRWGVNNRTVSLRIPAGPAASRHLEHRVPGADANPYLAASVVLAGMLHGIEQRIDPGPPMTGNAYDKASCDLPTHWHEALARASDSAFMETALGSGLMKVLLAVKRQEFEKFSALVSNRDYEWYLDTV